MSGDKHFWDETRKPWADLEGERRAVKPQKSAQKHARANENTGAASQLMAGFFQEMIMKEVISDFTTQQAVDCEAVDREGELRLADYTEERARDDQTKHDDDDLEAIRKRRLEELKNESKNKHEYIALGHGTYSEIAEADFLKTVTQSHHCIVHFFHNEFRRCRIMDMHLEAIASLAISCRFVKLNAEKAPFFVAKLKIKVLPTIVFFRDGLAVSRMVGFDSVSSGDSCRTAELVDLLREVKFIGETEDANLARLENVSAVIAEQDDDIYSGE